MKSFSTDFASLSAESSQKEAFLSSDSIFTIPYENKQLIWDNSTSELKWGEGGNLVNILVLCFEIMIFFLCFIRGKYCFNFLNFHHLQQEKAVFSIFGILPWFHLSLYCHRKRRRIIWVKRHGASLSFL